MCTLSKFFLKKIKKKALKQNIFLAGRPWTYYTTPSGE
jgi:hypothetical protein